MFSFFFLRDPVLYLCANMVVLICAWQQDAFGALTVSLVRILFRRTKFKFPLITADRFIKTQPHGFQVQILRQTSALTSRIGGRPSLHYGPSNSLSRANRKSCLPSASWVCLKTGYLQIFPTPLVDNCEYSKIIIHYLCWNCHLGTCPVFRHTQLEYTRSTWPESTKLWTSERSFLSTSAWRICRECKFAQLWHATWWWYPWQELRRMWQHSINHIPSSKCECQWSRTADEHLASQRLGTEPCRSKFFTLLLGAGSARATIEEHLGCESSSRIGTTGDVHVGVPIHLQQFCENMSIFCSYKQYIYGYMSIYVCIYAFPYVM